MSEVFVDLGAQELASPATACAAPFTSLYLDARGNVRACCINSTYPLGNITRDRLVDMWRGERLGVLRRALASGDYSMGCELCRPPGDLKVHPTAPARAFDHLAENAGPWPRQLELALSNRCNLQCEMCFGELSSSIRLKREGLAPLPPVYSDEFFDDLEAFLPHLEELHFIGGEPFLSPEAWRLWNRLDELGLHPLCHVTTNATVRTDRVDWLLEVFPVLMTVSMDGSTADTYERIRQGARFGEVVANLDHFVEVAGRRGTWVRLAFCLSTSSWPELPDILTFGEARGLHVGVNLVSEPARLSLWRSSLEQLEEVAANWSERDAHVTAQLRVNRATWNANLAWVQGAVEQARAERAAGAPDDPVAVARSLALGHSGGGPVLEVDLDEEDRILGWRGAPELELATGVDLHTLQMVGRPAIALMSGPVVDRFGTAFTSHVEDRNLRSIRYLEMTFAEHPACSVQAVTVPAPPGGKGLLLLSIRGAPERPRRSDEQ